MPPFIDSAEAAAQLAVELAERAQAQGTFGVGAILLHRSGNVLHVEHNRVIQKGAVADPTAHAERLLLDWYFDQRKKDASPPSADDCIVVSSIDPCIHCAGAILAAGFKAISVATDPLAGIFAREDFRCVPVPLREQARHTFFKFQCEHRVVSERTIRPEVWAFRSGEAVISPHIFERANAAFESSLRPARLLISADSVVSGSTEVHVHGTQARVSPAIFASVDETSAQRIETILATDGRGTDFAAFFDPLNNVVFGTFDNMTVSPVRTAFAELTRQYSFARNHPHVLGSELAHPKRCILLTKYGPSADAAGLITLGAYGSTMESRLPEATYDRWIYAIPRQSDTALRTMIANLPPLYSEIIGITVKDVQHSTYGNVGTLFERVEEESRHLHRRRIAR